MTFDTQRNAILARLDRPIVLIGMPAAGKTVLGRGLAHALGVAFIDIDRDLEATANRKIASIFETDGEPAFRDLEEAVLRTSFDQNSNLCVISTGGGAVLRPANRELIFTRACSIWVKASIPALLERTAKDTHRPLLKNKDPEQVLRGLAAVRTALYEQADLVIDTDQRRPEDILPEIITKIHERFS